MDTGAPATERGQQRRISLMILLVLALVAASLVYGLLEARRSENAAEAQREEAAERGANLFARNCVTCHGLRGQGLVGPALNTEANRPTDAASLDLLRPSLHKTITCGRVGTVMPAWGQTESGPLNSFQIDQLVALITTSGPAEDPEKYWHEVETHWLEQNPGMTEPPVPTGLTVNSGSCGQRTATPAPTGTGTASPTTSPTETGTAQPPQTEFTIIATDNAFDITSLTVPVGQEVTITMQNQGVAVHNVHVPDLNGVMDPVAVQGGQTGVVRFTAASAGTFSFLCDFHPVEMTGTITAQ
jgi:mono/diheme cytochrome c family protein/plastocyanin